MHPARKQRLTVVLLIVAASTLVIGLSTYAMRNFADFFYSVSAIVDGEAPLNKSIRAGGCVVPGSIIAADDDLKTEFVITDGVARLKVFYTGLLPDIFGDGEAAVVTGRMHEDGVFVATQVLAKHDENYVPTEVASSMSEADLQNEACKGMNYGS